MKSIACLALFVNVISLGGIAQTTQVTGLPAGQQAPMTLTLQDALHRAQQNEPQFRAALTEAGIAHEDRVQARSALLPTIAYNNQFLYTQGNGTPTARYIANNGVHEYISQGDAHQVLNFGFGQLADYRRTAAMEALAQARAEIAARGLVVTVTQSYYGLVVAMRKFANTQRATNEAQRFLDLSKKLEQGGEVAHSDVIKAQIQFNDQDRALREAQRQLEQARLSLAVLVFPNFTQDFTVVDDLEAAPPLPSPSEISAMANRKNPDLHAAMATLAASRQEISVARGEYFPTLTFDAFYGIDATRFATRVDGIPVLGYAAVATLNIPIWNWGATQARVKQAQLREKQARVELSATQRQLLANLQGFYSEAQTARGELDTLRNSADLAADSLRLTILRYQGGEATALEVVDAQNTLTLARNNYADGEARYRLALATLQTLTGAF
ncbi:MAG TPA: TolC family protein [Terriglobales bacterium]|nr:TolC family protein [Terriglobales bacterium]